MNSDHEIFISYSHDDRARVSHLARALESRGWRVWWDPKLMPGDAFDRVIAAALAATKVVVVVWSKVSVDRDWVLNEADEGRRRNILVPVCLDTMDVPLGFRRVQAADLTNWKGEPVHPEIEKLFVRIEEILGRPAPRPAALPPPRKRVGKRQIIFGAVGLAVLLLTAIGLLSDRLFRTARVVQGIVDCNGCPELISIPAGEFMMGSAENEPNFNPAEVPKRKVVIVRPFLIGRYEVTVGEYAEFVREQGQNIQGTDCRYYDYRSTQFQTQPNTSWKNPPIFSQQNDHPVVCVSWFDAKSYLAWLGRKTGKRYRLPSEAEWEYAARAGERNTWLWGNHADNTNDACAYANVSDESSRRRTEFSWKYHQCEDGFPFTAPVGSFQPNGFRLHDMIGNVWEWVEDCFVKNYEDAPADGTPRQSDSCEQRVLRGASWLSQSTDTRLAARGRNDPKRRFYAVGFRVVREP